MLAITVKLPSANMRRWSRVWIARVTEWQAGQRPTIEFGHSIGSNEAEVAADPGDLIYYGRKDNRGNGSIRQWAIVDENGELQDIAGESAARKLFRSARQEA